ncbi:methyltransferase family protein [Chitinophaga dinghuensis]|uniref:Methyltransferase family protein n=1 Tax=Chitinophaga dinghuensis TaxID=1539050 RepID=A0A327VR76_9BACT|nr:class I SAM-dependent methyltransferase [Chitinophaga dinghuensis]RAJ77543.1 methyltransferase family protein [Chitinophaga dinghuensis]
MDHYQETFNTWNKLAARYQAMFMDMDIYHRTYDYFCSVLGERARVLELGCGPGNITRYLLQQRPDWQLLATDVAPAMVELAAAANPGAECRVLDCRDVAQLEATYNGIVIGFCIPYLTEKDNRQLMQDCYGLLEDGGLLYLSFVPGMQEQSGFQTGSSGDRIYFHYYPLEVVQELLLQAGFVLLEDFSIAFQRSGGAGEVHMVIVAQKQSLG